MSVATPPARTPEVKLPVDTEAPVGTEAVRGGSPVSATASPVRAPAVDQPAEAPVGADAPRGKRKRRRRKRPRQSQQEETPYLTSDGCSDDNRPARIPVHLRLGDRAGEPHGPTSSSGRAAAGTESAAGRTPAQLWLGAQPPRRRRRISPRMRRDGGRCCPGRRPSRSASLAPHVRRLEAGESPTTCAAPA